MVQITNTSNTLGHFIVRDEQGSYDNEYNEALISHERSVALREAAGQALGATVAYTLAITKRAGLMALNALDAYIASGQSTSR